MVKMMLATPIVSLLLLAIAVTADNKNNNNNNNNNYAYYHFKDVNYYSSGVSPYASNPMYYSDPDGVLADLKLFSALFIHYHSCVWSQYGDGSTYYDASANLCGGGQGGGDENWYVGGTACFRANAAYSLYGIYYNDSTTQEDGSSSSSSSSSRRRQAAEPYMCNKKTYINTFYTTGGATMLSDIFGITDDTGLVTETCTVTYTDNGNNGNKDNNKDNNNNNNKDRDRNDNNNNNKISSTMGCNATGYFEYDLFLGGNCDGQYYNATVDSLEEYNLAMQAIDCIQIWDYEVYVLGSSSSNNNGNGRRQLGYGSPAETILAYSSPCGNYYYPGSLGCPGPVDEPRKRLSNGDKALSRFSWFCLVWGGVLLYLSYLVHSRKVRRAKKGLATAELFPASSSMSFANYNYNNNDKGDGSTPPIQSMGIMKKLSRTTSSLSQNINKTASNISEKLAKTGSKLSKTGSRLSKTGSRLSKSGSKLSRSISRSTSLRSKSSSMDGGDLAETLDVEVEAPTGVMT